MADPERFEEPARRRFSVFGLEATGCGCLLLLSPILVLILIWLVSTLLINQEVTPP